MKPSKYNVPPIDISTINHSKVKTLSAYASKAVSTKEVIEDLWCNCGLDNPEPKYHSIDCTYRVGWEDYKGCVHMLKSEVTVAEEVTGWRALQMKQYHPDFLDGIFMQRAEDAYHYGKRKE